MISVDEACRRIAGLPLRPSIDEIGLDEAHGRVLARAVIADRWAPSTAVSAMDGYAVCEADLAATPTRLRVVGASFAGDAAPLPLQPGACMRVFTGAPVPAGADRVVIQEVVRRQGEDLLVADRPDGGRHVRAAGSDFSPGEILLDAGALLTPQALVCAAAADFAELTVFAQPRVAILGTGDELAEPGTARARDGAIPENVSFAVAGLVRAWGGRVVARRLIGDDLPALVEAAAQAVGEADVVVVTGGASVGERDHAKAMFAPLGLEMIFEKVAMKPGKPVWMGRAAETLILGLPGDPSAAMITARLFLAPVLARLGGRSAEEAWAWRPAPLARPLGACGDRECFHKARRPGRGKSASQSGFQRSERVGGGGAPHPPPPFGPCTQCRRARRDSRVLDGGSLPLGLSPRSGRTALPLPASCAPSGRWRASLWPRRARASWSSSLPAG